MDNTIKLEKDLSSAQGEEKIKILLQLSKEYLNKSIEKSMEYGEQAYNISEKTNDENGTAKSLNAIGLCHYHLGNFELSLEHFNKALGKYEDIKNMEGIAQIEANIGKVHQLLGNMDTSLEHLLRSLKITEELNDEKGIAGSLNTIGVLYIKLSDNDKALEYLSKSVSLYKEINYKSGEADALNNIGIVYWNENRYHNALEYFLRSLEIKEEEGDKKDISTALNNIGLLYTKLIDKDKALDYYSQSLQISKEVGDKSQMVNTTTNIGNLYVVVKDFDKALEYLERGLKLAKEIDAKEFIKDSYYGLYELYDAQENYQKALELFRMYSDIKDEIYTKHSREQISEMQTRYETEKKKKEAEIYRLKNIELEKIRKDLEYKNEMIERQKNQLTKLNLSKDKFFSILAHDLKGPFTGFLGFSEILAKQSEDMSPEEIKELSSDINLAAKEIFNLLDNLLQWSRIQTGAIEFKPQNLYLQELTTVLSEVFKESTKKKNINLTFELNPDVMIFADKFLVDTVLRNLISNGIKYTKTGGTVALNAKMESGFVIVSVKDSGIGIEKENLKKLFKIEEKFSSLGTDGEKGTGLGLILSKELLEKNNGVITVESEIGKGSKFSFMIPSARKI